MPAPKPPIAWSDDYSLIAEGLHTAFRKHLDNKASAFVWHAIHLMEPNDWWQIVNRVATTSGPLKDRLIEDQRDESTWWDKPRHSACRIFFFALEDLDMADGDWRSVEYALDQVKEHFDDPGILDWGHSDDDDEIITLTPVTGERSDG